jgi:hypothetical protein
MQYQCRFLNHADRVFSFARFDAENDRKAILHALTVYWNGVGKGFEIWSGNRLLRRIVYGERSTAPAQTIAEGEV